VVPHRDEPSSQWLLLTSQPFDLGLGRRPRGGDAQSATLRGPTSPAGDALSNRIDWYASPRSGMSMLPRSCTSDSRSHDGVVIATSARWGASGEPLVGGVVARNPLSMLGSLRVASDNGCGELPSRTAIVRILRNSKKSIVCTYGGEEENCLGLPLSTPRAAGNAGLAPAEQASRNSPVQCTDAGESR